MEKILSYLSFGLVLVCSFFIWKNCEQKTELDKMKQNYLADSTKILKLQDEKGAIYQRYAYIKDLNDSANQVIKDREDKILTQARTIVNLKGIIASGEGHYTDTVKIIDSTCYGIKAEHSDSNMVYDYFVSVEIQKKPLFNLKYNFHPFTLDIYTTERKSDGIFSGYAKILPDEFNDYITISDMNVYVDETMFEQRKMSSFLIGPAVGLGIIGEQTDLRFGASALFDETHLVGAKYGLNLKSYNLDYSFMFGF